MSITTALGSALSGLTAASRAAEVVASNVANAQTPGYGRREISLQARTVGGAGQGVSVLAVNRRVDQVLINDRRSAEAGAGNRDVRADFLRLVEQAIGTPETEGSLGARIAALDTALIEAASRPESEARLSAVADAGRALTGALAQATDQIQTARATADRSIATEVETLNTALAQVADLNNTIRTYGGSGRDTASLMDKRQQIVDSIAAIVPLREVSRDNGQIALYAAGGAVLLEGKPAVLSFTPAGVMVPEMTVQSGGLSQVQINGRPVDTSAEGNLIAGGSLAALFAVRDDLSVAAQSRLDAVARDLVGRFADPAVDASLAVGDAGLFTDAGQTFDPSNEQGLAGRLTLNARVDPTQGGALWRLRDGIGAAAPGPVGQSSLLTALGTALGAARPVVSGGFMAGNRSFATLAADMLSGAAAQRLTSDSEASYAQARLTALSEMELQGGVDSDQELQTLLVVEQSYAANAKVIQSIDEMIQTLLGM